ncbi:MAG: Calx-beta domain-containing protein [Acidobacteriota bacterium]
MAVLGLLVGPGAGAAEFTVQALPNNTFSPANLTISVGDTVTWTNGGGFHNVAASDGSFRCAQGCDGQGGDGAPSSAAWSFSITFDQPGTINYVCEVHEALGMVGSIVVQLGGGDEPGNLRFAVASIQRGEGSGAFNVQVQRVGGDDGAVSVAYATSDGSAQAGSDYAATSGTLNWPDNDDDPRSFSVPITDDGDQEVNETINVMLSNPGGGAGLGSPSTATLTIVDDDAPTSSPGTLGFVSSTAQAAENGAAATIAVRRSGGTDGAVTVDYATSDGSAQDGLDYQGTAGTLAWADGESGEKAFTVPLIDDAVEEGAETVNLALSSATGGASLGTSSATLTITDDDAATDCVPDATTLCLTLDDRFRARITWRDFQGNTGDGQAVSLEGREDSGLFWFFGEDNLEMLIKVLDGCPVNQHFWVFFAATTNVEFTLTVTDTATGTQKIYANPLGQAAETVLDVEAFATCP